MCFVRRAWNREARQATDLGGMRWTRSGIWCEGKGRFQYGHIGLRGTLGDLVRAGASPLSKVQRASGRGTAAVQHITAAVPTEDATPCVESRYSVSRGPLTPSRTQTAASLNLTGPSRGPVQVRARLRV